MKMGKHCFTQKPLVQTVKEARLMRQLAAEKKCEPSQVALAWVLSRGEDVVPIPGTKRVKYVQENIAAADIQLSPDDLRRIDQFAKPEAIAGERYPAQAMAAVNR